MNLPPSFAKVSGLAAMLSASTENKQADGKNKGGSKDRKGRKKQKEVPRSDHVRRIFAAKFLFAIDKQVQHWLRLCKTAHNSLTQVNDRILQYKDLIDTVLNGTFHMNLPPSFAKVSGLAAMLLASTENKQADGKNKGGSKD